MDLTALPKPDDLLVAWLVSIFGPAALIVVLLKLYLIGRAWLDMVVAGRRGVSLARAGGRAFVATAGGALVAAAVAGIVLLIWVRLSYSMAHGASYLVHGDIPLSGPELEPFLAWRQDDAVSRFVFQGAAVVAVLGVVLAFRGRSVVPLAVILILPWVVFLFWMVVLFVPYGIGAIVNWQNGRGFQVAIYGVSVNPAVYGVLAAASVAYIWASLSAARLPLMARDFMRVSRGSRSF